MRHLHRLGISGCASDVSGGAEESTGTASDAIVASAMTWPQGQQPDSTLSFSYAPGYQELVAQQTNVNANDATAVYRAEFDRYYMRNDARKIVVAFADGAIATNKADCEKRSLSAHMWFGNVDAGGTDVTGVWHLESVANGEFPVTVPAYCSMPVITLDAKNAYDATRVSAQARITTTTLISLGNGPKFPLQIPKNVAVKITASGTYTPSSKLSTRDVQFSRASDGTSIATTIPIHNDSGTDVYDEYVNVYGTYKYCDEPGHCLLNSIASCTGAFCPPGVLGPEDHVYPLPSPKTCHFEKHFSNRAISHYGWDYLTYGPITTYTAGCGPCNHKGQCADVEVEADVSMPSDVYTRARTTGSFDGVLWYDN